MFFFFNDTATTEIYTLSLHDALPICNLLQSYHEKLASTNHLFRNTCSPQNFCPRLPVEGNEIFFVEYPFHLILGLRPISCAVMGFVWALRPSPETSDRKLAVAIYSKVHVRLIEGKYFD